MPQRRPAKIWLMRSARTPGRKVSSGYRASKAGKSKRFKNKYARIKYNPRGSIFGKQYYCKLNYQALIELDSVGSSMAQATFRANSLYDPDFTGVGGQPLFFDTLCGATDTAAPFTFFRVCGAKIKCHFVNDNTATSTAGAFFIHWRYGGAGTLDSISELGEQPNTKMLDVNSGNGPYGNRTLSTYISIKRMLGVKDIKDDEDSAGSYTANPAKVVYFDVGYQPYQAAVTTNIFVRIKISFYCQFFAQNELTQS